MIHHPFPHAPLSALAAIALAVSTSCSGQARPSSAGFHPSSARGNPGTLTNAHAASPRSSPDGRPDPLYRPPTGFSELRAVAGAVAKATGRKIGWDLTPGKNPGPLVSIGGGMGNCTISIHPVAARQVPPNTWAFLFGHEFAHLAEDLGDPSDTTPAKELRADIAGARYAMAAGYRLDAFLGWVLTEPDSSSNSHGSLRRRVQAIATHFGIPSSAIQAQARRYSRD
ncbi:MAG: hypothetical protein ABI600_11130 [Luteolibacter sp.]